MEFLVCTKFNFLGHRRAAFILSMVLIVAGVISLVAHGGPKLGIDFRGGILLQVQFANPIPAQDIRDALSEVGFGDAEIQHFGGDREAIIRVGEESGDVTDEILEALALGQPVVATEEAVAGLDLLLNRDIMVESNPARFAAEVVRLLENPHALQSLGSRARRAVHNNYSHWSTAIRLEEVVNQVALEGIGT